MNFDTSNTTQTTDDSYFELPVESIPLTDEALVVAFADGVESIPLTDGASVVAFANGVEGIPLTDEAPDVAFADGVEGVTQADKQPSDELLFFYEGSGPTSAPFVDIYASTAINLSKLSNDTYMCLAGEVTNIVYTFCDGDAVQRNVELFKEWRESIDLAA